MTATQDGHTLLAVRKSPVKNEVDKETDENTLEFTITSAAGQSILLDSTGLITMRGLEHCGQKYAPHVQDGMDHFLLTQETGKMKLGESDTRLVLPDGTHIRKTRHSGIQVFLANGDMALRSPAAQPDSGTDGWTNISADGER